MLSDDLDKAVASCGAVPRRARSDQLFDRMAQHLDWQREGFRLLWRWRSRRGGRPPVPADLQVRIVEMARENPAWSPRRIQKELLFKLGIQASAETVPRTMPHQPSCIGCGRDDQRWATFVRHYAHAIVACDPFVAVMDRFQVL